MNLHARTIQAGIVSRNTTAMRGISLLILAGILFAGSVPLAHAAKNDLAEMSLESLMEITVVGASRYKQRLSEAPSYVTVVTREEIRRFGHRNLADVLRSIPGVYTSYDRSYHFGGVRGFSPPGDFNTRFLLVVDGHRINNNIYDQALIGGDFPIDIDLVERVEFVRGPGSSVYGSNAFFGIVNVITRNGEKVDGAEASTSAASHRTFQGRATYGRKYGDGPEVLLSGTMLDSHGQELFFPEYNDPATNNGLAEGSDHERTWSLFGKIAYGGFTLEGVSGYRKKHVPTGQYGVNFNDSRTYVEDQATYLDLRYEKELSGGLDITARLFWDEMRFDGSYMYGSLENKDVARGVWWGAEVQVKQRFGEGHILSGGAEYRGNAKQDQENYDVDPYSVIFSDKRRSYVWSGFLQGDFRLFPGLIASAGGRYDDYETFGGNFSPRASLVWLPRDTMAIKLLYGSAFRAPNVYELYYSDSATLSPNPSLEPETIVTYEVVLERYWDAFDIHWKGTAAGYKYRIDNLITAQPDPSAPGFSIFLNGEPVDANGLELELEGKTNAGFEGRVSYGIQRASEKGGEGLLSNSPKHTAKLNLVLPILRDRITLDPEVQFFSSRRTATGKPTDSLGGYALVNLTLFTQKLVKGLEVSATVYNLLDKNYNDPVGEDFLQDSIPQDGRSYRLKATYQF